MQILIGVDDTDNIDSNGTGETLDELLAALREQQLGSGSLVTRHQLYIHEEIPYTTHNSAMCCQAEVLNLPDVIEFSRACIRGSCAAGSDPGLCIIDLERLRYQKRLIRFGRTAKESILKKRDALDVAGLHRQAVYLYELGGTGLGVIGALAGCGLRLSGYDGTVRAALDPPSVDQVMTVGELCVRFSLAGAVDERQCPVDAFDSVRFCCPTHAVFWRHEAVICLAEDKSGAALWRVCGRQELKGLVV